jgi:hypothetical protein
MRQCPNTNKFVLAIRFARCGEGIVDRSDVRYKAAGCLIAIGVLVGGTGGVALADTGSTRTGSDGTNQTPHGPTSHSGTLGTRHMPNGPARPRSKVGDGRDTSRPRSSQSTSTLVGVGNDSGADNWQVGEQPSGEQSTTGGDTKGEDTTEEQKNPRLIPLLFPWLNGGPSSGSTGLDSAKYYQRWTRYYQELASTFQQVLVPQPPQPEPQIRTEIVGEEPVLDSGGGGGGSEPAEPAAAEQPVVQAPVVVAPPIPALSAPPAIAPATTGTVNTWLGPRMLPEPAPPASPGAVGRPAVPEAPAATAGNPVGPQPPSASGYARYLRTVELSQLAAAALPGVAGILFLTAGGGFVGYRQAKAGQSVRTRSVDRFLS